MSAPTGPITPSVSLADALRRHLALVVVATLVGAFVGGVAGSLVPVRYRAETTVYLADPSASGLFGSGQPLPGGAGLIGSTVDLATSPALRADVAESLDISIGELVERTTVVGDTENGALRISATSADGADASETVVAFVAALEARLTSDRAAWAERATAQLEAFQEDLRRRLEDTGTDDAERESLAASLIELEVRARELAIDASVSGAGTHRLDVVDEPTAPVSPGRTVTAGVGGLLGLLVAAALAWRRAEHHPRVTDRRDAQRVLGVPLVGSLVPARRRWPWPSSASPATPAPLHLGTLLRGLVRGDRDAAPRLHVVGLRSGGGTGAVALAVAVNAARGGNRIVVTGELGEAAASTAAAFVVGEGTVRVQAGRGPVSTAGADLVVVAGEPVLSDVWVANAEPPTGQPVLLAVPRESELNDLVEAAELLAVDGAELVGYVDTEARRSPVPWRPRHDDTDGVRPPVWVSEVG